MHVTIATVQAPVCATPSVAFQWARLPCRRQVSPSQPLPLSLPLSPSAPLPLPRSTLSPSVHGTLRADGQLVSCRPYLPLSLPLSPSTTLSLPLPLPFPPASRAMLLHPRDQAARNGCSARHDARVGKVSIWLCFATRPEHGARHAARSWTAFFCQHQPPGCMSVSQ